ncbi:EamA family transporter [Pedobacter sp. HMF7647]|uniref:EamA family transporter n=1 Tax=Hufsiella arboris TaxID=2695275 RepID=A0A7K1YDV1_9SPHI|nr:EamA family transporter [Hufsiella arboris]MXV52541.1 EamA family transporter [Hufsiella arboris]
MKAKFDWLLFLAVFCVAFFWGTTFLMIRIGVESIPPMLVTGFRNIIAGTILLIFLLSKGQFEKMDQGRWARNLTASFILIVLGNGLTTVAEQYIPSGLASLISTLSPLIVLVLNLVLGHEKISAKITIGLGLGICGMYLIYSNSLNDLFNPKYKLGIEIILGAVTMWSVGTVYSKSISHHKGNILVNMCVQMLFAGVFLLIGQLIWAGSFEYQSWTNRSIIAVIYLAIFGSVIGYISYMYLLSKLPSTKVSIITYINVVVALSLGWLILNEKLTLKMIIAAIVIITGVIIANYKRAKNPGKTTEEIPASVEQV